MRIIAPGSKGFVAECPKLELGEQFDLGRRYAAMLGPLPSFVPLTVRGVRNALQLYALRDQAELSKAVFEVSKRLFRASPTYEAVLYYAVKDIYAEKLAAVEYVTVKDLIQFFAADELCAIVALVYLMRQISKHANDVDRAAFNLRLRQQMAIARQVGLRTSAMGPGNAMLAGGMRCLAQMHLLNQDEKARKEYRRKLNAAHTLYYADYEIQTYGTTNLLVAAALMQMCGYGVGASAGVSAAHDDLANVADESRPWARTIRAVEELACSKTPDQGVVFDHYFKCGREELPALRDAIASVFANQNCFDWINRSKEDLILALDEKLQEEQ